MPLRSVGWSIDFNATSVRVSEPLLRRMADGDQSAVSECITRYGGLVWSLARRLLRDPTEAEDGVQEAFVAVWQSAGRFDPAMAKEATFVAMIARRRLIDRRRRLERIPEPMTIEQGHDVPARDSGETLDDEAARLKELWGTLRDEERLVLQLATYDGWTYAEIAERHGIPLGTVKSRARSGMQRLREGLLRTNAEVEEESR